jgi:hypothetical protein
MLDATFVTNASKCANCASMALGWFGVDLVADFLSATPFTFWPLVNLGIFVHFLFGIDLAATLHET